VSAAEASPQRGLVALYLLDTDVLIDVTKGREPATSWVANLMAPGCVLCSCAVTIAEYYSGEAKGSYPDRDEFVGTLAYLDAPSEAAEAAGEYRRSFARRGIQLSTQDVLVAAIARHHGATVVSRNAKDFPMDDVRVVSLA